MNRLGTIGCIALAAIACDPATVVPDHSPSASPSETAADTADTAAPSRSTETAGRETDTGTPGATQPPDTAADRDTRPASDSQTALDTGSDTSPPPDTGLQPTDTGSPAGTDTRPPVTDSATATGSSDPTDTGSGPTDTGSDTASPPDTGALACDTDTPHVFYFSWDLNNGGWTTTSPMWFINQGQPWEAYNPYAEFVPPAGTYTPEEHTLVSPAIPFQGCRTATVTFDYFLRDEDYECPVPGAVELQCAANGQWHTLFRVPETAADGVHIDEGIAVTADASPCAGAPTLTLRWIPYDICVKGVSRFGVDNVVVTLQ